MDDKLLSSLANEEWLEASIDSLQKAMDEGQLTSRDLVMFYLHRIATVDKAGPAINSVLEVNPDALHIAESLDLERKERGKRGPLHGIPVLIKDNIDTADKMHTSAGSIALANSYAQDDAFLAKRLREAGAVILGKANMTEWANFIADRMPSGYSSRGGQVLNPYGPGKFDVGGSSSGSGASVAANLAAAAVGTETSGSILSPSSQNSLVGIKPTLGLISRTGVIPIAHSQDTAGPMARSVRDAAILLGVLAAVDETDVATLTSVGRVPSDYTEFLREDGLRGKRLGVPRVPYFKYLKEDQVALMEQAIAELRHLGAEVVDPIELPYADSQWGYEVLVYEFKSDLNAYLKGLRPEVPVHSIEEVVAFNERHADKALKYGQAIMMAANRTSGTLTEPEYLNTRLLDMVRSQREGIDKVLQEQKLDALVFPANFGAGIPAKAGYPSITVPCGYTSEGEPLGVTFTASAYSEPLLISLAYAYEQATHHRRMPTFATAQE